MPVSSTPKRRRAADFQPESLAAAGWLESKVSEREFKNFQDLMREAIDGLLADFASHESRINEKMKEMEESMMHWTVTNIGDFWRTENYHKAAK